MNDVLCLQRPRLQQNDAGQEVDGQLRAMVRSGGARMLDAPDNWLAEPALARGSRRDAERSGPLATSVLHEWQPEGEYGHDTIATAALRPLLRRLRCLQTDVRAFLAEYSLTLADVQSDKRIAFSSVAGIWEHAAKVSGDANVGLNAGQLGFGHRLPERQLTLEEQLEMACSYARSLSSRTFCYVRYQEDSTSVVVEPCGRLLSDEERRQALEFMVSILSASVRSAQRTKASGSV
jgi:hypothetical protein